MLPADRAEELKAKIAGFEQETRTRYPDESSLSIALAPVEAQINDAASEADSAKLVELIMSIPQGVYEWSTQFAGLPQTSNNIGIVKTDRGALSITAFARSFDPEALERIAGVIEAASKNAGAVSARRSSLPPWPPKSNSDLYRKSMETYERLFKEPLKTELIHAGLECGYFVKGDDIEIISIGPTLENVHTPRERLYVPSLERISGFLGELLGQL